MSEYQESAANSARIKVVGVGKAGGNVVNRMIDERLEGVEFIAVNTDARALAMSMARVTLPIGAKLTGGLGAGAHPEIGRQALEENRDEIRTALMGADLVLITAGMGGGTGTGAAPIIAEIAREIGALTIAVVTKPFLFEGEKRLKQAKLGLAQLKRAADTTIVIPNESLLKEHPGSSFKAALERADMTAHSVMEGIVDLIRVTGEVEVRTTGQNPGTCIVAHQGGYTRRGIERCS